MEQYIKHLNPDDETLTMANVFHRSGIIPWTVDGPLGMVHDFVNEEAANVHHGSLLNLTQFQEIKEKLLHMINMVLNKVGLDGFVYPQMSEAIPGIKAEQVASTTIPEINISGLPLITVPAGYYTMVHPLLWLFGENVE
ncbi:hypothetical protein [Virgibacillus salexigens]|uniref:hypothetical protein n=1 Tax=Virgibacillus TaxID=84406 RepID=UPI0011DD3ABC|nr:MULTISPECIES: hypothetical protein [Virgibacillus]